MPRRPPVRFVEQIDSVGTISVIQQRDIPDWKAKDDGAAERAEEFERQGAYVQLFLDQMHRVEGLTGAERKMFDLLVRKMAFGEPFVVSPTQLAGEYGTAIQNVSSMLKTLRDQGILIRIEGLKHLIDPRLAWQGSSRTRLDTVAYLRAEGLLK